MCACIVHVLGIGPSRWRFPVPISPASDEEYDDDPPLKKLCVFLCMPQTAPECTRMRLRTHKTRKNFPPDPPPLSLPHKSKGWTAGQPCSLLVFPVHSLPFAGHQGSSQSDLYTNTGFDSFKFLTCVSLRIGQSHSHTKSSLVIWLRCIAQGVTRRLCSIASIFSGLFIYKSG